MPARKAPAKAAPVDLQALARRVMGKPFAIGPASQANSLVERVLREGANFTAGDPRDVGVRGGYPQVNVGQDHKAMLAFVRLAYKRSAPARVLVDRVAEEEWGEWFDLTGGRESFRQAVEAFMKRPTGRVGERPLWWWFKRATRLARRDGRSLLHFGLIEPGLVDPEDPPAVNVQGVAYLQIITQDRITDKRVGEDDSRPEEFGEVLAWKVAFPPVTSPDGSMTQGAVDEERWIHADRVIPFIPDPTEDDLWEGDSILATNVNYVEAVENMLFAALQAYHREAEPMVIVYRDGTGMTTDPQKAAVKRELRKVLEENTERAAFVHGVKVEVLQGSGQLANPTPHWDIAIQAYAMATGIPRPILTGEQIGELVAATEVAKRWANVISRLQETDGDPIANTLLARLDAWGVERWARIAAKDAVEIKWRSIREEDPNVEAGRQKLVAEARAIYWDRQVETPEDLDYAPTTDPEMLRLAETARKPAPANPFGQAPAPAAPLLEADAVGPPEVAGVQRRFKARILKVFQHAFEQMASRARATPTLRVEASRAKRQLEADPGVLFTLDDMDALRDAVRHGLLDAANQGTATTLQDIDAEGFHRHLQTGPAVFTTLAGEVAAGAAARLTDEARQIVAKQLAAGSSPDGIAKALMDRFEASRVDAERIARTESIRGFNEGAKEAMRAVGITMMRFEAFADADAQCLELDGQEFPLDALGATPPIHPNCVLPGAVVDGSFVGGLKANYSGPAREFVTASGKRLAVTANHPVLTSNGFAPAHAIQKGDHLVGHAGPIGAPLRADAEDAPARIEEVFDVLADAATPQVVPLAPEDLHGDAARCEAEVSVARTYGQLGDRILAYVAEGRGQAAFVVAGMEDTVLTGHGGLLQLASRPDAPARRSVGGSDLSAPSVRLHAAPLQAFRLGLAPEFHASALEGSSERAAADARAVAEMLQANPGTVLLDEVVEVRDVHYYGHVYDLQTPNGAYWASGLMIHNCRCALVATAVGPGSIRLEGRTVGGQVILVARRAKA